MATKEEHTQRKKDMTMTTLRFELNYPFVSTPPPSFCGSSALLQLLNPTSTPVVWVWRAWVWVYRGDVAVTVIVAAARGKEMKHTYF